MIVSSQGASGRPGTAGRTGQRVGIVVAVFYSSVCEVIIISSLELFCRVPLDLMENPANQDPLEYL